MATRIGSITSVEIGLGIRKSAQCHINEQGYHNMLITRYTLPVEFRHVNRGEAFSHQDKVFTKGYNIGDWPPHETVYIEAARCTECQCYLDAKGSCDSCLGG